MLLVPGTFKIKTQAFGTWSNFFCCMKDRTYSNSWSHTALTSCKILLCTNLHKFVLCTNSVHKANCLHITLEGLFHWCTVFLCHVPISSLCFPLYRAGEKCLIVWPGTIHRRKQYPQGVISIAFWTNALLKTRSSHRPRVCCWSSTPLLWG